MKIVIKRYSTPKSFSAAINDGFLRENKDGSLFDFNYIPKGYYEVVLRSIRTKKVVKIIYKNIF